MPIPNFDDLRRPALELLSHLGSLTKISDVFELLAPKFHLTEEEIAEMLPSNSQRKWNNRVNWSCYDLYKAGLLDRPTKGCYQINDAGREALKDGPTQITRKYLSAISKDFLRFVTLGKDKDEIKVVIPSPDTGDRTPDEQIEEAFSQLNSSLASELQDQMAKMDPFRFEQLVVDLLFAMGYGGSREEAAKVTKKSNDEGIDGVINEDRLGLDVIYIQAKRWQNSVGRKEIQSFVGALAGQQANKGVFITTGGFAQTATDYAKSVQQKVILIDGPRLAELMIEHNIGVTTTRTISLKRIDSDYFDEV